MRNGEGEDCGIEIWRRGVRTSTRRSEKGEGKEGRNDEEG